MRNPTEKITAVVAIIRRHDGAVLFAQRPAQKAWGGYWELPGGKLEQGETHYQALVRELKEEVNITITEAYPWLTRQVHYPIEYDARGQEKTVARHVTLHCFIVNTWHGDVQAQEGQILTWQYADHVTLSPLLPASQPILSALTLPVVCGISHLSHWGESAFLQRLHIALEQGLNMVVLREKELSAQKKLTLAQRIKKLTDQYQAKLIIHTDADLAYHIGANGVHLSANDLHKCTQTYQNLICGASCHTPAELKQAMALELQYAFVSPVLHTHSHPHDHPLTWAGLTQIIQHCSIPVYALGGMHHTDLHSARQCGAHGIALRSGAWV